MNNNLVAENPRLLAQCEVWSRQPRPQRGRGLHGEQRGGLARACVRCSDAGLIGPLVAAEAISPGKVVGAVVSALEGESVTQAGGRSQEAAAGGRVHAHGGPSADGQEDGQWELLQ